VTAGQHRSTRPGDGLDRLDQPGPITDTAGRRMAAGTGKG